MKVRMHMFVTEETDSGTGTYNGPVLSRVTRTRVWNGRKQSWLLWSPFVVLKEHRKRLKLKYYGSYGENLAISEP